MHGTHPYRLIIHDPEPQLTSWYIHSDPNIIKQQRYLAVSYQYEDIVPRNIYIKDQLSLKRIFNLKIKAIMKSLHESTYWTNLTLIDETTSPEEVN
ncbi:hypothetical protein J3R82DRAFT_9051 [Butyriboletus roseoflavus]|nr:hypothetical protein J3R82DRAFT_9051 [Butyriboletus roseoflavus]